MATRGDVVAVVHADTIVRESIFTQMIHILSKQPGIAGGAVGGIFDSDVWRLRVIELANDFRMVFLGISLEIKSSFSGGGLF